MGADYDLAATLASKPSASFSRSQGESSARDPVRLLHGPLHRRRVRGAVQMPARTQQSFTSGLHSDQQLPVVTPPQKTR